MRYLYIYPIHPLYFHLFTQRSPKSNIIYYYISNCYWGNSIHFKKLITFTDSMLILKFDPNLHDCLNACRMTKNFICRGESDHTFLFLWNSLSPYPRARNGSFTLPHEGFLIHYLPCFVCLFVNKSMT